jgi:hypothetical protein
LNHLLQVMLCSVAATLVLGGCGTVVAAADAVGTTAVLVTETAADAAIGGVRIVGKVVGKAADAVLSDSPAPK